MKKGIIGYGGFGREVYWSLNPTDRNNTVFFVDDEYWVIGDDNVLPLSSFEVDKYEIIVAIGDPTLRESLINRLPKDTKYFTHIHQSVQILGEDINIGEGSIICAGSILTTNINIGKHAHINLNTTIGHDVIIGDYFTTAPGVRISGNVTIGNKVYFGTGSCVRQKLNLVDNVTIGMNAAVVKHIEESGIYVGVPIKKI